MAAPPSTRISLACVPCRNRHLRCDGTTPVCSRCRAEESQCTWLKSRRGGRPRTKRKPYDAASAGRDRAEPSAAPGSSTMPGVVASLTPPASTVESSDNRLDPVRSGYSPGTSSSLSYGNVHDLLLSLYYDFFHASSPCCLPRPFLDLRIADDPPGMRLLVLVMKYVGSFFATDIATEPFRDEIEVMIGSGMTCSGPYEVQAFLLLSTTAFWNEGPELSHKFFKEAALEALRIGMHLREFSLNNSSGSPVLAESWRRTWWQIYICDVHMAAIKHLPVVYTNQRHVTPTTELPCEEREYESGEIPQPKTIEQYELREFSLTECHFSSFAHLIGLTRGFDRHVLGHQRTSDIQSDTLCTNAESAVRSWQSLLPDAKTKLFDEDGIFDESMFKANMMIQVYVVDLHRSLSKLAYDPIERVSDCSPPPPLDQIAPIYLQDASMHTSKILYALDQMSRLLTMSPCLKAHTPYILCMISSTTIAYLSACKHVLRGEHLNIARERIRAAMGALRVLAEVWPRGQDILKEVKIIANELLGLGQRSGGHLDGRHVMGDVAAAAMASSVASSTSGLHSAHGSLEHDVSDESLLGGLNLAFENNPDWFFGIPASMTATSSSGDQPHSNVAVS